MTIPTLDPATHTYLGIPSAVLGWLIFLVGLGLFGWIIYRRWRLLRAAAPDPRFSHILKRIGQLITYGILQRRQPRYLTAGIIHIMIFWGFVVLGLRSMDLVTQGLGLPLLRPLMESGFGDVYGFIKDIFELLVLTACMWAILRRAVIRPERYQGSHQFEAYLVLGLISFLMITDMFLEGSALVYEDTRALLPAAHLTAFILPQGSPQVLEAIYVWSYWLHIMAFFFFLNLLPLSKHFHIITALPNVFFKKLTRGALKPVRWDAADIEDLDHVGVDRLEDFTWKHILDFYTCTECGRCTDNCPAAITGRPLSPKLLTMKLRDHAYEKYPVFGRPENGDGEKEASTVGGVITAEEIWSCTTCGACEEECPVFIEYIDKMIDMRRHLIETSQNPKTFNQVLMHVEKTGNPFGKPPSKRADWTRELEDIPVKIVEEGEKVDVLYFVDSYGSYDPRVQQIAGAIARGLYGAGVDFGILGPMEWDTGHQVRRIGEEGLFQLLLEENLEALKGIEFNRIITTDPHALNTFRKDYPGSWDVQHYASFFLSLIQSGRISPVKPPMGEGRVFTYHDPCYLGRHNEVYEAPRELLRHLPGVKLVEMERNRDRSFCCGGGDVILWHEIEQEEVRMAELRVKMARDAGADTLVTACPFCLIHFEDAVKTAGMEQEIRVMDLMELLVSTL